MFGRRRKYDEGYRAGATDAAIGAILGLILAALIDRKPESPECSHADPP